MKIAILGTRGIPNEYGGFEQFAEFLSVGLAKKKHNVVVYSPHDHSYKKKTFKKVNIKHIFNCEKFLGPFANFFYDFFSLYHANNQDFDIIYQAGYQSSSVSTFYFNKKGKPFIITNMDGIEWKRSKWSYPIKLITKIFEKIAIKYSDFLISDNIGIQKYYKDYHNVNSYMIPYGAELVDDFDESHLIEYKLIPNNYYLLIARIEPENNLEIILDGYISSKKDIPFLVIGNSNNRYGKYLKKKYNNFKKINFIGSVYNKKKLDSIRFYSKLYFHGHSVGGTNPSLLEAMASKCCIISHNNDFNKSILDKNALYFNDSFDVKNIIKSDISLKKKNFFVKNNLENIKKNFLWSYIIEKHEILFKKILRNNEDSHNNSK